MQLTELDFPLGLDFPAELIAADVQRALDEDFNHSEDWTARLIAADKTSTARITTNQEMVLCGSAWATAAFQRLDPQVTIEWHATEGSTLIAGSTLAIIKGNARGLLSAERTALNFLQTLSATATLTAEYLKLIEDTSVSLMDTRKTIPGLRLAQKYAVRVGGGQNQRMGLFDGVLIKENHILAHDGISAVLAYARANTPANIPIQIEVESLSELDEAVAAGARLILLDNFSLADIQQAVANYAGHGVILEISGNVNRHNLADYANSGVHRISIGALTKNIQAIDLSLRFI